MCELCGENAIDIHHRLPQKEANNNGFIDTFHKNHPANLESICKVCHLKETKKDSRRVKKKTMHGYQILDNVRQ